MSNESTITIILVALIIFFSLRFDKPYAPILHEAARHPFARLIAGGMVVYLSTINPLLALLALIVVFFWVADVNLLSSFNL